MGILNRLLGNTGNASDRADRKGLSQAERNEIDKGYSNTSAELQHRMRPVNRFPAILDYVDMHQRDGWPDPAFAAFGSRYQLVQMLSLRDPDDTRWLNDSHPTPIWLRTSPQVWESQRNALAPTSGMSPYTVEAAHVAAYAGVPTVGRGPGTTLVIPIANQNQRGVND